MNQQNKTRRMYAGYNASKELGELREQMKQRMRGYRKEFQEVDYIKRRKMRR